MHLANICEHIFTAKQIIMTLPIIKFNLRQLDIALISFEKYIEKTRSENKKILETTITNPALNFRQADLIINMSKNERPITFNEVQECYNVTHQTARSDLLGLEK